MKRIVAAAVLALLLALGAVSPAFAATGREFGEHHSQHAKTMGGFTGDHNPGVHHRGYSGWHHHD